MKNIQNTFKIATVLLVLNMTSFLAIDLTQIPTELLVKGREKYETIEQNTRLPNYSDCWLKALNHLNDGCRVLSDSVQSDLALHFTNCFLLMSGSEEVSCVNERTEALKRLCIKEMPDRAYSAYLEFYSDAQNICFFLQHQLWHKETEKTINSLSRNSKQVVDQLKEASEMQSTVLEYQKQGVYVQQQLLEKSVNLSDSLSSSKVVIHKLVDDVKEATANHKVTLDELFKEFHLLHSWLVGRYSLVDKIIYYGFSIFIIMVATSFSFTASSRVYLLSNHCLNYLIEASFSSFVTPTTTNTITFDSFNWTVRKLFIFNSILIFIYFIFKYEDKIERQIQILKQIENQNRKIIDDILYIKLNKVGRERARDYVQSKPSSPMASINDQSLDKSSIEISAVSDDKNLTSLSRLPILVELDYDEDGVNDETLTTDKFTRSVSRASTVSQSSTRYNLRRRSDVFHMKN